MKKIVKDLLEYGKMHFKCRNRAYPRTNGSVERFPVPDDKVSWDTVWAEYNPVSYTSPVVHGRPWADPDLSDESFNPQFNKVDGNISRVSYVTEYRVVNRYPLNPVGRTGLTGRGVLGRWGPNHAADPIATRWKKDLDGNRILCKDGKPVLQFVAIKRRDNGHWAIPGGMVDAEESPMQTLRREFMEEALNSLQLNDTDKNVLKEIIDKAFTNGTVVYKGYVDDPRNTDNAWIETLAMHFHDEEGTSLATLPLVAGDDAASVAWTDIDHDLNLYASHIAFFKDIVENLNAHW